MQSSFQLHLLLITDKMSPKHPERMRRYRVAAELFKGKVSPNKRGWGGIKEKKKSDFFCACGGHNLLLCALGEQRPSGRKRGLAG